VARRGAEIAEAVLPEHLPLAVGHGDYAPRNVFLRTDGRVSVFDPMLRWSVPRYEDLARFLVALRLSGNQVLTQGATHAAGDLDSRERAVVDGYGGGEKLPLAELRCYQLLITLDRWSALIGSRPESWRRRIQLAPVQFASGYLRGEAERLLSLIDQGRADL
jgi:aminoglycoside phosphotransferase (APT) family kinase protein